MDKASWHMWMCISRTWSQLNAKWDLNQTVLAKQNSRFCFSPQNVFRNIVHRLAVGWDNLGCGPRVGNGRANMKQLPTQRQRGCAAHVDLIYIRVNLQQVTVTLGTHSGVYLVWSGWQFPLGWSEQCRVVLERIRCEAAAPAPEPSLWHTPAAACCSDPGPGIESETVGEKNQRLEKHQGCWRILWGKSSQLMKSCSVNHL